MKRIVVFAIIFGIAILSALGGMTYIYMAEDRWEAFVANGDKPSVAYIIRKAHGAISGEVYILEPSEDSSPSSIQPRDLTKGVKYEMNNLVQSGNLLSFNILIQDSTQRGVASKLDFKILFKDKLEGDKVESVIQYGTPEDQEKVTFLKIIAK